MQDQPPVAQTQSQEEFMSQLMAGPQPLQNNLITPIHSDQTLTFKKKEAYLALDSFTSNTANSGRCFIYDNAIPQYAGKSKSIGFFECSPN